jgi:hypothetical protein
MPPSGYIKEEANYMSNLLLSNISRLRKEAEEKNIPIETAILDEIANINSFLSKGLITTVQKATLLASLSLYERLRKTSCTESSIRQTIDEISEEILLIKVPEKLTKNLN